MQILRICCNLIPGPPSDSSTFKIHYAKRVLSYHFFINKTIFHTYLYDSELTAPKQFELFRTQTDDKRLLLFYIREMKESVELKKKKKVLRVFYAISIHADVSI